MPLKTARPLFQFDNAKVQIFTSRANNSPKKARKKARSKKNQIWYRWQMAVVILRPPYKRNLKVNNNIIIEFAADIDFANAASPHRRTAARHFNIWNKKQNNSTKALYISRNFRTFALS